MTCVRQTHKRYTSRPSPPYHAKDCAGKVLTGNDGEQYKSTANKNGVFVWVRKTRKSKATKLEGSKRKKEKEGKE